jgi:septal ring factor EnvC (AmiA/AmiB activator)
MSSTNADPSPHATISAMAAGRRADSARRRERVLAALNTAVNSGAEISVSAIARAAGVDRTFLYRHRDLLEHLHTAESQPRGAPGIGPAASRASLQADLAAAQHRCARMATRIQQLEAHLSELLGAHAWRESGLGTSSDIDQLNQQIVSLEQHVTDLHLQLQERDQDLAAARAANRELMASINITNPNR